MEFTVTQQVAVTAESVSEALGKAEPRDGNVITANVVPRPKPTPQGIQTLGQFPQQAERNQR
jgi:hypothetical protein